MSSIKSKSKVLSLVLLVAIVFSMFSGLTMGVSAAAPLGLSAPENVHWETTGDGSPAQTGKGVWDEVDNAIKYEWRLFRNDTGEKYDPWNDECISVDKVYPTGTGTVSIDFNSFIHKDGYYYFLVCSIESDAITGTLEWNNSDYRHNREKPTPPVVTPGGNGGSSSSGGSGSNKADGVSTNTTTNTATATSKPVTKTATDIKTLTNTARTSGSTVVTSKASGEVTIKADAWKELSGLSFQHDTIAGGKVAVRVTISNPTAITGDVKVSGYVSGSAVNKTEKVFDIYFSNETSVLHFDQTGLWGQDVLVAAKFDLAGMNKDNLVFYTYDRATNQYRVIENPQYSIDANGYTCFSTSYAGDIVVSDGFLAKK